MKKVVVFALVLAIAVLTIPVWAAAQAQEVVKVYKGAIFDNGFKVRDVTLNIEGNKVTATFGKAGYPNMSKPEEFTYADEVANPGKFLLNPSGAWGGGYTFSLVEGRDEYIVKVELSNLTTGKSGKSFCEGRLLPSSKK